MLLALAMALAAACTSHMDLGGPPPGGGGQAGGRLGSAGGAGSPSGGHGGACVTAPASPTCGNGTLDPGESCDDGNVQSGDGCSAACRIEASWSCGATGMVCVHAICGDGVMAGGEACDDGNATSGDGCSGDCLSIEKGWRCGVPGMPCSGLCGDGLLAGHETCDDGNAVNGDGCSEVCQVEAGATCAGMPSLCTMAVCGNGVVEPGESCDDGGGNGVFHGDGTGCSATCSREPKCVNDSGATTSCAAVCGNGVVESGEACDDGNQRDGDGCSSACAVEPGFSCASQAQAATVACRQPGHTGQCLEVPVTYRDFKSEHEPGGHADFYYLGAVDSTGAVSRWCIPDSSGPAHGNDATARCWGIAANALLNGKPQFSGISACPCQFTDVDSDGNGGHVPNYADATSGPLRTMEMTSPAQITQVAGHPRWTGNVKPVGSSASFATWFADGGAVTATTTQTLELAQVGTGRYRFASAPNVVTGGYFPLDPVAPVVTAPAGEPLLCNLYPYWSSSFPSCQGDQYLYPPSVDPASSACMMSPSGCGQGIWVTGLTGARHDFWFTQEIHLPFVLKSDGLQVQVVATDDLFVFVNGNLTIDLGGTHQRVPGKLSIDSAGMATITEGGSVNASGDINPCGTADPLTGVAAMQNSDCRQRTINLGLQVGQTYELAIFGANRHPVESYFDLMLTNIDGALPTSACAPLCGDGVVTGGEACDDGKLNADDAYGGCTTNCKLGPYCGDGVVDTAAGEACDDGPAGNDAVYSAAGHVGSCGPNCRLPHYCGDGVVDAAAGEECDLGAANGTSADTCSGSACSATCQVVR